MWAVITHFHMYIFMHSIFLPFSVTQGHIIAPGSVTRNLVRKIGRLGYILYIYICICIFFFLDILPGHAS